MYKVKTQSDKAFEIDNLRIENKAISVEINGEKLDLDYAQDSSIGSYHFLQNNKGYRVSIVNVNAEDKTVVVNVNGHDYELAIQDKLDLLLEGMGLDNLAAGKDTELKAPMPGLVLDILVTPGQEIKKGDALVILEAMKMENVLKASDDATIASIEVTKGIAVEKNQVLVQFA